MLSLSRPRGRTRVAPRGPHQAPTDTAPRCPHQGPGSGQLRCPTTTSPRRRATPVPSRDCRVPSAARAPCSRRGARRPAPRPQRQSCRLAAPRAPRIRCPHPHRSIAPRAPRHARLPLARAARRPPARAPAGSAAPARHPSPHCSSLWVHARQSWRVSTLLRNETSHGRRNVLCCRRAALQKHDIKGRGSEQHAASQRGGRANFVPGIPSAAGASLSDSASSAAARAPMPCMRSASAA